MRKLTRKSLSKKAFTLLEVVLAMAITIIVIPLIFGTFYLIHESHAKVAVINDAKDFASLNSTAINNLLVNASSARASGSVDGAYVATIYADSNGDLYIRQAGSTSKAFEYPHYTLADGTQKWRIELNFQVNPFSKTVDYTIDVYDNSNPSATEPYYKLESSVFLPNGNRVDTEQLEPGSGSYINFSNPVL
jgi:uncharacterized protein (UPF0333 family)